MSVEGGELCDCVPTDIWSEFCKSLRKKKTPEKMTLTSPTRQDMEQSIARRKMRSSMTRWLCGFYGLVITVLGIVFPVSTALTYKVWQQSYYNEIYQIYLFAVSVMFLVYLHIYVLRRRRRDTTHELLVDADDTQTKDKINSLHEMEPLTPDEPMSGSSSVDHDLDEQGVTYPVTFEPQGVNFYLRLGAIAFSVGSMVHDGLKVAQQFELRSDQRHCRAPLYVLVACARMVFVFVQTFYLFKSHRVMINMHKAFVRFGFVHLIATNLCVWVSTLVQETAEDYSDRNSPRNDPQLTPTTTPTSGNDTMTWPTPTAALGDVCDLGHTLAWRVSPYLYPCTIEYSLVAAGIIYHMYTNIGQSGGEYTTLATPQTSSHPTECHKANKGLFAGLVVFVLTVISVSSFFVFDQKSKGIEGDTTATVIFFVTELLLLSVGLILVVVTFVKFQQLRFLVESSEDKLNVGLLVVSYAGVCLFNCFLIVSTAASVDGTVGALSLLTGFLAFIQTLLQIIFILDAGRRCAGSTTQVRAKPGRGLVTFLLFTNLALLVVNMFEVKKTEIVTIHAQHYGDLAWSLISHLTLPLIIFFRFHSTVCLSDIWMQAYQLKGKGQ